MLDDNLPTFIYKPSDNPLSSVLYFTHLGSAPSPEYLLRRPDPSASRNTYALALADARYPDVIFSEILVRPELALPTLDAVEIRAQREGNNNNNNNTTGQDGRRRAGTSLTSAPTSSPPPTNDTNPLQPAAPDTVVLRLYNPDQNVGIRMLPGSWARADSWEFEMPEHSFRAPSTSKIDQGGGTANAAVVDFTPKIVFRWKRDGRLSRDMTCYMTGKSVAGKKSKEPDITVALYKGGKNESLTVYEPNLHRVDVQDRKGLEVVLLLGAAAIRDLYLDRKNDPFNTSSALGSAPALGYGSGPTAAVMSGALAASPSVPPVSTSSTAAVDEEARWLQREVDAEAERQQRDRERRDREEQDRIRRMLDDEDRERRRRDAEVEAETERLRRMYGTDGQAYNNSAINNNNNSAASPPPPNPPPRPVPRNSWGSGGAAAPGGVGGVLSRPMSWFVKSGGGGGGSATPSSPATHSSPVPPSSNGPSENRASRWFSRDSLGLVYGGGVAGASSSGFFGRGGGRDDGGGGGGGGNSKLQKKKSVAW